MINGNGFFACNDYIFMTRLIWTNRYTFCALDVTRYRKRGTQTFFHFNTFLKLQNFKKLNLKIKINR